MSDYSQAIDFSAKDALVSGNPSKLILGADVDSELALISTAVNSKLDEYSAATNLTTFNDLEDMISVYDTTAGTYKRMTFANLSLYSAASKYHFTVFMASDQTLNAGALTYDLIEWNTENVDYGNAYSGSAFTCIDPGMYLFTSSLNIRGPAVAALNANDRVLGQMRRYSSAQILQAFQANSYNCSPVTTSLLTVQLVMLTYMNVGDYVNVYIAPENNNSICYGSSSLTWFRGLRLL